MIGRLTRSSGELVDGHLRLKAAEKLAIAEVPVILCDDWSDAQVKAFRLLVNRSVTWADWDMEPLSLELTDLKDLKFDMELTGFDGREIDRLLIAGADGKEDVVPDLPENPSPGRTIFGDVGHTGFYVLIRPTPKL